MNFWSISPVCTASSLLSHIGRAGAPTSGAGLNRLLRLCPTQLALSHRQIEAPMVNSWYYLLGPSPHRQPMPQRRRPETKSVVVINRTEILIP